MSSECGAAEKERIPSGPERYVANWDTKHIVDAASAIAEVVPVERSRLLQRILFRELAIREARTAVALTEALAPSLEREILRLEVVLAWADEDWPAAAAWVAQWPSGLAATRTIALETMSTFATGVERQETAIPRP